MVNRKKSIGNNQEVLKNAELLYTNIEIKKAIDDIAKAISKELKTSNPIMIGR